MIRTARPKSSEAPAKQLAGFIAKFDPTMAKRIRSVRAALRRRFPTAIELVYDNYNFFVIGYSTTERASDSIVSLAANAKGVGLAFIYGATLPDPQRRLRDRQVGLDQPAAAPRGLLSFAPRPQIEVVASRTMP